MSTESGSVESAPIEPRPIEPGPTESGPTEFGAAEQPAPLGPPTPVGERVVFALRQSAILGVCLVFGGLLVDRLRPEEAAVRDIFTAPFLWAAALWTLVLLFHALAFERPVNRRLEREPLFVAGAIGVAIFVVGVARFTTGPVGQRIIYLATNALGSVLFWWSITSLVTLLVLWVRPDSDV